jgi:hypothetical protein
MDDQENPGFLYSGFASQAKETSHSAVGGIWFCRIVQMNFTLLAAR